MPDAEHAVFRNEIVAFLNWVGSREGQRLMGRLFQMVFSLGSDRDGEAQVREYHQKALHEGFTPDVGIPVIELLISSGEHLRQLGAPVPSYAAVQAMKRGDLGRGGEFSN